MEFQILFTSITTILFFIAFGILRNNMREKVPVISHSIRKHMLFPPEKQSISRNTFIAFSGNASRDVTHKTDEKEEIIRETNKKSSLDDIVETVPDPLAHKSSLMSGGHINITKFPIDMNAIAAVPAKVVLHYKFLPLELKNNVMKIAVNSVNNVALFDDIRTFLGFEVVPFLAREEDIISAINHYYGIGAESIEDMIDNAFLADEPVSEVSQVQEITVSEADEAIIIKFVNKILYDAYQEQATDIHIEPYEDKLKIRYRIDGHLVRLNIPRELIRMRDAIISRIKIMGNLDIAERRLPQDGRVKVKINNECLDLRISIVPTPFGESLTVRLLSSPIHLALDYLGFMKKDIDIIDECIHKPHGIVLVTGPTGSGKTSTLYTCLSKLNCDSRKIVTIEDPVEYNLDGITQMQINSKIKFTFARGLRSILRHDPNIIMVGEIRDTETAEIAFRSALTGHLVFSTVHTNTASKTITRLVDIGLPSYLIADSLNCIIAQRLVRKLCPHCKEKIAVSDAYVTAYAPLYKEAQRAFPDHLYVASGCTECRLTGYQGRTVIYEILRIDKNIRYLIHNRLPVDDIAECAMENGMVSLFQSGLEKVHAGITSIGEVMKLTNHM